MGKILSVLEHGSGCVLLDIECYLSNSLPNILIVGFASKSVDEAKERIRGALAASNIKLPKKRVVINLAPADIPKEGSAFDLPIITSILCASGIVKNTPPESSVMLGEVSLDGTVRPIRGMVGKILSAKKLGITEFWIPKPNLKQAQLIPDINIVPVGDIKELCALLNTGTNGVLQQSPKSIQTGAKDQLFPLSIDDVAGQEQAKRALTIAAAGHHNILLNGPPGVGKSMLAKALISLMPNLSQEEILEITHIHSLSNRNYDKIVHERPFRSPHHSSSHTAIVGGGQNPKPGEISLSHNGILLLDEFPEFSRTVIEALRQPMEDQKISISRAKNTVDYPAHFLLVATSNPCPCGYFGSNKECTCTPSQILSYQKKISGPILDRIDIYIEVEDVDYKKIIGGKPLNQLSEFRTRVQSARHRQSERNAKLNSKLSNKDIEKYSLLSKESKDLLNTAAEKVQLSPRGYIRTLRVARSIADIENCDTIEPEHISEALQYRRRVVDF